MQKRKSKDPEPSSLFSSSPPSSTTTPLSRWARTSLTTTTMRNENHFIRSTECKEGRLLCKSEQEEEWVLRNLFVWKQKGTNGWTCKIQLSGRKVVYQGRRTNNFIHFACRCLLQIFSHSFWCLIVSFNLWQYIQVFDFWCLTDWISRSDLMMIWCRNKKTLRSFTSIAHYW